MLKHCLRCDCCSSSKRCGGCSSFDCCYGDSWVLINNAWTDGPTNLERFSSDSCRKGSRIVTLRSPKRSTGHEICEKKDCDFWWETTMKLNAKKTNLLSWRQPVLWAVIIVGDVSGRLVATLKVTLLMIGGSLLNLLSFRRDMRGIKDNNIIIDDSCFWIIIIVVHNATFPFFAGA